MKRKRHGVLFAAFTLVLGITMLTTSMAVPHLRPVRSIDVVEAQSQEAAAAAAQEAPVQQAKQSPAFIPISIPSDWDWEPGDQPLTYKVEQHNKGIDGHENGTLTDWYTPAPIQLDVLSSYEVPTLARDAALDAALPDKDVIVPGSEGEYSFTLSNQEPGMPFEYLLNITEGPASNRYFPLKYSLKDDRGKLTADGISLAELEQLLFIDDLDAMAMRKFTLKWEWDFERGSVVNRVATGDPLDTALGEDVRLGFAKATETDVPTYQLQLNLRLRAPEGSIWIIFDPVGGFVTPDRIEYNRGDQYLRYGDLPIPTREGYRFVGWADENGNLVDPNDIIPPYGGTVYAVWEKIEDDKKGGIIPIPIPIPLPIPIPIPLPVIHLPCWKCLRPCDKCTCNGSCHDPRCPKKADAKTIEPPPKTGDSATLAFSALAMLVISGGTALILYRKRRDEDE